MDEGRVVGLDGTVLLNTDGRSTSAGRDVFIDAVGHRWASFLEVWSAKQGAVSGSVETRDPINPIIPRNLPNAVNEYGFDVGNYGSDAWWVVSESTLDVYTFSTAEIDFNGSSYSRFGSHIALSDSYLAVSLDSNNWERKKVYVYGIDPITNEISDEAILVEPLDWNNESSNGFGRSLALSGNWLVVGAPDASSHLLDENGNVVEWRYQNGSLYVFDLSNGTAVQTGKYSYGYENSYLGRSIDVNGSWVVAGAPIRYVDGKWGQGAVCLFEIETNGSLRKLEEILDPDGQAGDNFGEVVRISNGMLAVSSPSAEVTTNNGTTYSDGGRVFFYSVSEDGDVQILDDLHSESPNYHNRFGNVMDFSQGTLVVGDSVTVYAYDVDDVGQVTLLNTLNSITGSGNFGHAVSLDGDRLAVSQRGSYWDPAYGSTYQQEVYYFNRSVGEGFKLWDIIEHSNSSDSTNSLVVEGKNFVAGYPGFDGLDSSGNLLHDVGKIFFISADQ
jgi:hypothetical protein